MLEKCREELIMKFSEFYGEKSRNIFIGNFSCEEKWNIGMTMKLPVLDLRNINAVVQNMDELMIFLADSKDIVILRKYPDQEYIKYLIMLGIEVPQIVTPIKDDLNKSIGELVLEDKSLLCTLKKFVSKNSIKNIVTNLIPYGVTRSEEKIADIISAEIFSTNQLSSKINCKLTLSQYALQFNISFPERIICNDVNELEKYGKLLQKKHNKIVIKAAYSSGGSGLAVVDTSEKLSTICRCIRNDTNKDGYIMIEKWYNFATSYNHQYFISDNGIFPYCFSQQVIKPTSGNIMGSVFNSAIGVGKRIWSKHYSMSQPILRKIQKMGYRGVIGFDSLVSMKENVFFPVIDINCRINLSTIFAEILSSHFYSDYSCFICREYVLSRSVPFKALQLLLGDNAYSEESKEGIVILNFTTLNYNILRTKSKYGNLFFGIFAKTEYRMKELRAFVLSDAMSIKGDFNEYIE